MVQTIYLSVQAAVLKKLWRFLQACSPKWDERLYGRIWWFGRLLPLVTCVLCFCRAVPDCWFQLQWPVSILSDQCNILTSYCYLVQFCYTAKKHCTWPIDHDFISIEINSCTFSWSNLTVPGKSPQWRMLSICWRTHYTCSIILFARMSYGYFWGEGCVFIYPHAMRKIWGVGHFLLSEVCKTVPFILSYRKEGTSNLLQPLESEFDTEICSIGTQFFRKSMAFSVVYLLFSLHSKVSVKFLLYTNLFSALEATLLLKHTWWFWLQLHSTKLTGKRKKDMNRTLDFLISGSLVYLTGRTKKKTFSQLTPVQYLRMQYVPVWKHTSMPS